MLRIIKLYGFILKIALPPEVLSTITRLVQLGSEQVYQGQGGFFPLFKETYTTTATELFGYLFILICGMPFHFVALKG